MAKKAERLVEDEYRVTLKHTVNETLSKIEAEIYARVHTSTKAINQSQLSNALYQGKVGKTSFVNIQKNVIFYELV